MHQLLHTRRQRHAPSESTPEAGNDHEPSNFGYVWIGYKVEYVTRKLVQEPTFIKLTED